MRRFFMAMVIGGLIALGYGGVTTVARADGAEPPQHGGLCGGPLLRLVSVPRRALG